MQRAAAVLGRRFVRPQPVVVNVCGRNMDLQDFLREKLMARGLYDTNRDDPFDLFISSTDIRWCYYKDTQKILGTTWGMCVLQDFETLTPNLLARTVETVEGGGIVVLLLKTMSSLRQLQLAHSGL